MDKNNIWCIENQSNGEQTVLDRVINGLRPRLQMDMRSEELKASELANAMEMLKRGQILALNHNAIAQDVQTETATAPPKKPVKERKARKAKKAKEENPIFEPENDGE